MKKLILSLAAVAALASCSQEEGNKASEITQNGTPIAVNAGIETSVVTKVPVTGTAFKDGELNLFRLVAYDNATQSKPTDFSTPYFNNSGKGDVNVNSKQGSDSKYQLLPDPAQYYPVDGNYLYFYAFAPGGEGVWTFTPNASAPTATITIDGSQDIMWAMDETGIQKMQGTQSQPALNFIHKLMQVTFKAQADASFTGSDKVTKLTIKGIGKTVTLNPITGTVTFGNEDLVAYSDETGVAIETDPVNIATSVMFQPSKTITLDIETANGNTYQGVVVDFGETESDKAGYSYNVTLNFKQTMIVPTASITEWKKGTDPDAIDVE